MRFLKLLALPVTFTALGLAILSATSSSSAFANETITYSYDAKGRLIRVEHHGDVNNNVQANYSYDKADNRLTVNVTGAP